MSDSESNDGREVDVGRLTLLVGPVGAGKTTVARRRTAGGRGLVLDVDAAMVRLYGDDPRPAVDVLAWYVARRERVRALLWDVAEEGVRSGLQVFLELGLVAVAEREAAYREAVARDLRLRVLLVDAPRDVRRARVLARNAAAGPTTQVVPPAFFEAASDAWEPVSAAERAAWDVVDG